jgi:uncharacterized coiled-coil DUF342 family protein
MMDKRHTAISIRSLRAEYETAVRSLRNRIDSMRQEGQDSEAIARTVHAERRKLAKRFKDRTPEPLRSILYQRTEAAYCDPLGPSIERLRSGGKTWEEIAESATRPGPPPAIDVKLVAGVE